MEVKVSTDKKIVKMFRRLEKFLDQEGIGGQRTVTFQNAETGRPFAVFISPETWEELVETLRDATEELESANETIAQLKDDNALLALIDTQNEVLMGRVSEDSIMGKTYPYPTTTLPAPDFDAGFTYTGNDVAEGPEPGWPTDGVCGVDDCPCNTTEASSAPDQKADSGIHDEIIITAQEYEELLNLRKKRANNHEQLSAMDAKLKEKKKAIRTLEDSRDHWKASYYDLEDKYLLTPNMPDIESPTLYDPDRALGVRTAFTSDAIRD